MSTSTKQLLRRSLDFEYALSGILWFGGISLLMTVVLIALLSDEGLRPPSGVTLAFLLLFFLPVTAYYAVRMILLFRRAPEYRIYRATVTAIHDEPLALQRAYYCELELHREDGTSFPAESHAVFRAEGHRSGFFGDYLNRSLQVLYSEKHASVVVIGAWEEDSPTP